MEQFIPIILFLVVSLLFNRLGERNKEPDQEQKREQPTPSPMQRPTQRVEPQRQMTQSHPVGQREREPVTFEKPRTIKEAAEIFLSQVEDQLEPKKKPIERQLKQARQIENLQDVEAVIDDVTEAVKDREDKKAKAPQFPFQENDIVNGIVMAEVFGPPRAQRPYRQRR